MSQPPSIHPPDHKHSKVLPWLQWEADPSITLRFFLHSIFHQRKTDAFIPVNILTRWREVDGILGNQFHQFSGSRSKLAPGLRTHLEVGACQAKAHSNQCGSSAFPTSSDEMFQPGKEVEQTYFGSSMFRLEQTVLKQLLVWKTCCALTPKLAN